METSSIKKNPKIIRASMDYYEEQIRKRDTFKMVPRREEGKEREEEEEGEECPHRNILLIDR